MFFKYVYGKIQQYPHFHLVTWRLSRNYFGVFRIFNYQIDQPQLYIKDCAESLKDYEPSVSSSSTPLTLKPPPLIKPAEVCKIKEDQLKRQTKLLQVTSNNYHHNRRKQSISIKFKLYDESRKKRKKNNAKKLSKLILENQNKLCLVVIEKSSGLKRNGHYLKINNNNISIFGRPYCKILEKSRKRTHQVCSTPIDKNIEPSTSTAHSTTNKIFTDQSSDKISNPEPKQETTQIEINNMRELENDKSHVTNIDNTSTSLTIPTSLIPYENESTEEKPLRHWPTITQLLNNENLKLFNDYLSGWSSKKSEDDKEDSAESKEETTPKEDEFKQKEASSDKPPEKTEEKITVNDNLTKISFIKMETFTYAKISSTTSIQQLDKTEQLVIPNLVNDNFSSIPKNKTDSFVNMRLLSSVARTYETITIPYNSEDTIFGFVRSEDEQRDNQANKAVERDKNDGTKRKNFIYVFIIIAVVLLLVALVLIYFYVPLVSSWSDQFFKSLKTTA